MAKVTDGIRRKKQVDIPGKPAEMKHVLHVPAHFPEQPEEVPENVAKVKEGQISFLEKFGKNDSEGILITEELEALEPKTSWLKGLKFSFRVLRNSPFGLGLVSGGVILVALVVMLSTVFARATLTYVPRTEEHSIRDVPAALDSSVSKSLLAQHVLPAEHLQFSRTVSEKFESTSTMSLEEKARGRVKLYNAFSSSAQTLVERTRFLAGSGLIFRLSKTVVIPGAQIQEGKIAPRFIEVDLIADLPGEQGNIPEGTELKIPGFQGTPKYAGFYAVASTGFSGGFKGEARVVSAEDIKRAQEETTRRVYREIEEEMARKIPSEFILLAPLREITITGVSVPKENSRHDQFSAEARAEGNAIVFRKKDVFEFIGSLVPMEGKSLIEEKTTYEFSIKNADFEKGRASVVLQGNAVLKAVISSELLAAELAGKKEGTIIDALRLRKDIASFKLTYFPPWLFRTPADSQKIKIYVENP